MPLVTHIVHLRTKILTCFKWLSVTKHDFARFCARFVFPLRNLAQNLARNLARKSCDRTGLIPQPAKILYCSRYVGEKMKIIGARTVWRLWASFQGGRIPDSEADTSHTCCCSFACALFSLRLQVGIYHPTFMHPPLCNQCQYPAILIIIWIRTTRNQTTTAVHGPLPLLYYHQIQIIVTCCLTISLSIQLQESLGSSHT